MFQIKIAEDIPANTRSLSKIVFEGTKFVPRKNTTIGPGSDYWVDLDPVEIPTGHIGVVTYGNAHQVGTIRVIPKNSRAAKKAIKAFNGKEMEILNVVKEIKIRTFSGNNRHVSSTLKTNKFFGVYLVRAYEHCQWDSDWLTLDEAISEAQKLSQKNSNALVVLV